MDALGSILQRIHQLPRCFRAGSELPTHERLVSSGTAPGAPCIPKDPPAAGHCSLTKEPGQGG